MIFKNLVQKGEWDARPGEKILYEDMRDDTLWMGWLMSQKSVLAGQGL